MFAWKFVYFVLSGDDVVNTNMFTSVTRARIEVALDFSKAGTIMVSEDIHLQLFTCL